MKQALVTRGDSSTDSDDSQLPKDILVMVNENLDNAFDLLFESVAKSNDKEVTLLDIK